MTNADAQPKEGSGPSWKNTLLHQTAAWSTVLCLLAGLWHGWMIPAGGREWQMRFWPGHLLIDALEVVGFTVAGLTIGGWWWWVAGWRRGWSGLAGVFILAITAVGACAGWLQWSAVAGILGALMLLALVRAIISPRHRPQKLTAWCRERRPWNLVFFCSFVLLNTVSDVLMTATAPPGWLEVSGFVAGRFLTQLVIACLLWLALLLGERWWPRGLNWFAWTAVAFAPLLVAVDMVLRLAWTKSLYLLCAELENGGRLDMLKIREGGTEDLAAKGIIPIVLCILAAPAWFLFSRWLSRRGGWRMSGARLAAAALTAWVALMALHLVESLSKPLPWRHWESRETTMQLTPFSPPKGLVTFSVTPADPAFAEAAPAARRPDIFLFITETLRADAIHPERTPFLARWRDEECQMITETRSASNATHLSWFSILHGRVPWHAESAAHLIVPAPLLSLLHGAGYAVEVRAAGNFDYCEMRTSNFGDGSLLRVFEHTPQVHPDRAFAAPERERRLMQRLRDSVAKSPPGGVLWLTAIDSGHYPYKWHEEWKPPYADFEENPMFPVRPTPEEIARVQRRYWNSVSWGDHLVGEFIAFLKASGRYDESMIVLTGDHGEEFKEHGSWFHCSALNPQQTRVPIFIKWPASIGRGPALADASHLDLVPSMLDAAGLPESIWRGMPGRSLRRDGGATSIIVTCYASQNGETMVWRRDGYEAAFSWSGTWVLAPPGKVWLERLEGPDGPVTCASAEEYEAELRRRFPDAFVRSFAQCVRVER